MATTLAELGVRYGCEVRGNPETSVSRVGTLQNADAGCITFLANPGYRKYLVQTTASAVILTDELAAECPVDWLIAADPYLTYARIATELHPQTPVKPGVHPSAVVGEGAEVPPSCGRVAG